MRLCFNLLGSNYCPSPDNTPRIDVGKKGEYKTQKSTQVEQVVQAIKQADSKKDGKKGKGKLTSCVLGHRTEDVKELYNLGKKLGAGSFGITYFCTEKKTGLEYACKTISKKKLLSDDDVSDVRKELQIMHHLSGKVICISCIYVLFLVYIIILKCILIEL